MLWVKSDLLLKARRSKEFSGKAIDVVRTLVCMEIVAVGQQRKKRNGSQMRMEGCKERSTDQQDSGETLPLSKTSSECGDISS